MPHDNIKLAVEQAVEKRLTAIESRLSNKIAEQQNKSFELVESVLGVRSDTLKHIEESALSSMAFANEVAKDAERVLIEAKEAAKESRVIAEDINNKYTAMLGTVGALTVGFVAAAYYMYFNYMLCH